MKREYFEELCKSYHLSMMVNRDGRDDCSRFGLWLDDAKKYMIPVIAWEPPRILGLLGCVANPNPIEGGGPMFAEHSVVMILGDDPAYTQDIGILRASMAVAETYVRMAVDRIGQNAPEIMRYLDNRENPEHLPFFDDVRGIKCRLETLQ